MPGGRLAGASALGLIAAMLFPWFGIGVETIGGLELEGNAWQALGFVDVVMFFAAIAVLAIVLLDAADPALMRELPASPGTIILGAGALATALIVFRLVSPPELDFGNVTTLQLETERKIGAFLGLAAAVGMAVGGIFASRETTY